MSKKSDYKSIIRDAEIYYKLSEEMKLAHPLIAYYANLHGLEKVSKNLNKTSSKKDRKLVMEYLRTKTELLEELKPNLDISK